MNKIRVGFCTGGLWNRDRLAAKSLVNRLQLTFAGTRNYLCLTNGGTLFDSGLICIPATFLTYDGLAVGAGDCEEDIVSTCFVFDLFAMRKKKVSDLIAVCNLLALEYLFNRRRVEGKWGLSRDRLGRDSRHQSVRHLFVRLKGL
jgi:hypothetical protein